MFPPAFSTCLRPVTASPMAGLPWRFTSHNAVAARRLAAAQWTIVRRLFAPYRVLRVMPSAAHFFICAYVARLGMSMIGVSVVVMIAQRYDSYALAGLVSFVALMSMATGGPLLARAIDRFGQRRVALPGALLSCTALAALAIEAYAGAPSWALVVTNLGQAAAPSAGTLVRTRWSYLLREDPAAMHVANSFEQVAEESCFVVGPALGAGLAAWLFPEAGLLLAVVLTLAGLLGLLAHRVSEPPVQPSDSQHRILGAFTTPGLLQLAITLTLTGAVFGGMDVVVLAYAQAQGAAAFGGLLIGFFAAGSLLGGLLYGLVPVEGAIAGRLPLWTLLMFALLAPLLWVPNLPVLAVNGFIAGLAIAPTLITAMTLCPRLVPAGQLNEGMTIVVTGLLVGVGVGSALAGSVIESAGAHRAFIVPIGAAGVAFVIAVLGRSWLTAAERRNLDLVAV